MPERLRTHLVAVARGLRSSRALLVVAVLTLAAAIGLNVAMFGLVDRALISPARHLADPESVFTLALEREDADGRAFRMTSTSYPHFRTLLDEAPFDAVAAWTRGPSTVVLNGEQIDAETVLVSDGYFALTGVAPRTGPGFSTDLVNGATKPVRGAILPPSRSASADRRSLGEGGQGRTSNGAVLSHAFWTRAFGGDPNVLGRHITIRGISFPVTGVMPRGFSGHAPANVDAWFPIEPAMSGTPNWDNPYIRSVTIVARVPRANMAAAAARASAALETKVVLLPVTGDVESRDRRIAYWLSGVSIVVLLIGLANATTLLVVRAAKRRRETAIRAALGASRAQLLTQVASESLLIGFCAAAASLLLAAWLDEIVRSVLLPNIVERDGADLRTIAAAGIAGLVAALLALAAGASHVGSSVAQGFSPALAAVESERRHGVPAQKVLLLAQTTLSVLLLAGAGMFGRSLSALLSQDLGMRLDEVLVVDFEQGAGERREQAEILMAALDAVRALPGVDAATQFGQLPFTGFHVPPIAAPGRPKPNVDGQPPFLIAATPELFRILEIRIVDGRGFTELDDRGAPVVIVNETMARGVWPGERAVGKCIRIGFDPDFDPATAVGPAEPSDAVPCREVIGIARDTRQRSIVPTGNEARLMQYYVPFSQIPPPPAAFGATGPHIGGLLVRTSIEADALVTPIRRLLVSRRADLPAARVRPYASLFERQVRPWRLGSTLLAIFSALAVAIAAVGLYAAFAHAVTLRRREIAIRLAVGASASSVRTMILRDAVVVTGVGTVAGLIGAFAAGRSLQSLLYGIAPADPIVLAGAAGLMLAIALLATALPARSAARTDPNALLRAE